MAILTNKNKWLTVFFGALLVLAFFLPWLNWTGSAVRGYDFPAGSFFEISESKFDLAHPFPQYSFLHHIFWLIPGLGVVSLLLLLAHKKTGWLPAITGVIALSLVTIYILFTQTIIEQVGLIKSLTPALNIGIYATLIAAAGIIIASIPRKPVLKAGLLVIGPLCTWLGFQIVSGQVLKSHDDTAAVKSAYTVNGLEMIREFEANDSMANAKYKEKIITVNGRASAIELINDSTVNIKIVDTTGAYAIFSFDNGEAVEAKKIRQGDSISLKGSCSGGEYSNILGVHFITFKRSIINK